MIRIRLPDDVYDRHRKGLEALEKDANELVDMASQLDKNIGWVIKGLTAYQLGEILDQADTCKYEPISYISKRLEALRKFMESSLALRRIKKGTIALLSGRHSDSQKDIFTKTAALYENLWNGFDRSQFTEATELLATRFKVNKIPLSLIKMKKCVDAGCGSGRYSEALVNLGAGHVTGVDASLNAVKRAKIMTKNKSKRLQFRQGDVLNLPFKEETFDFVFSNGVVHHTTDPFKGIYEIGRVMKDNGAAWLYIDPFRGLCWFITDAAREICKDQEYATNISLFKMFGLAPNRIFHFLDFFHVPLQKSYAPDEVEDVLLKNKLHFRRLFRGVAFDQVEKMYRNKPYTRLLYADGELRYLLSKEKTKV